MERVLSDDRFEVLKAAALADCEASDVSNKLAPVDLDPATVAVAVSFEQERRQKRYETAIFNTLEARVAELAPKKQELDNALDLAKSMLSKLSVDSEGAGVTVSSELPDDLLRQLSKGVVGRDTFVTTATLFGHTENVSARTFHHFARWDGKEQKTVNLEEMFNLLVQANDREGQHPLLRRSMFGPAMLDSLFTVCDAYLTATEAEVTSESSV